MRAPLIYYELLRSSQPPLRKEYCPMVRRKWPYRPGPEVLSVPTTCITSVISRDYDTAKCKLNQRLIRRTDWEFFQIFHESTWKNKKHC